MWFGQAAVEEVPVWVEPVSWTLGGLLAALLESFLRVPVTEQNFTLSVCRAIYLSIYL